MKKNIQCPTFSVIIPVYNKEKYIKRTIDSVLNQTYPDFEIIIVDDKSTDKSLEIIKDFKDKRIRVFRQGKNKGASFARNFGIKKAQAPYIAFLDADDEYLPDFLSEITRLKKKYKNTNFFATAFRFVDSTGKESHNGFGNKKDFLIKNVMLKMINDKFFFHISSIVVGKKIFDDVGVFQSSYNGNKINNVISEDSDLYLRISEKYKLAYSNIDGCIYYRNISNSVTNNTSKDINLDYRFYEKTLLKLMSETTSIYKKQSLQKLLNQLYEKLAVRFIVRKQYKMANDILSKSDKKNKTFYKIKDIIKKAEISDNISQKTMDKRENIINKKIRNIILNNNEISQGKISLKSFPSQIHMLLTTHCNLKCVMCDVHSDKYKLSDKQFEDLIELMPYLQLLIIQGGEVFFDKRIDKLLDEAKKNMVQINLFTNGLMLTESIINKLIDTKVNLIFSIDSPFKDKYESIRIGAKFEDLIENISLFNKIKKQRKSKIEIGINMVVMKRNYKDISDMIKFAKKYKFKTLLLSAITGNLPDKNENFFNGKKDYKIIKELSNKIMQFKKQAKDCGVSLFNHLPLNNDIKKNIDNDCGITRNSIYCTLPFTRISIANKECSPDCRCLKRMPIKNIPSNNKNSILNMWNSKIMIGYRKAVLQNVKNKICPEFCFKEE